ncbi:MAG: imidazole glycerol phosphate synthase subunit HisH [Rikenellaceae bacterium]
MIAVTDYDTGNLRSVMNALQRTGAEFVVTSDEAVLRSADKVIMPGVGEASSAMQKLRERGLDRIIPSLTQPVLGICIGMQLMCEYSEEGDAECLGIFPTKVMKLPSELAGGELLKVPHVGWDTIENLRTPLFEGIKESSHLYYVHSFAAQMCDATIASTTYGVEFSAALHRANFYGTQFHPEKSGTVGEAILNNFLKL